MAELINIKIQTEAQTNELSKIQKEIQLLSKRRSELNKKVREGITLTKQEEKEFSGLDIKLTATKNRYNDLKNEVLRSNDAFKKSSGLVAGIQKGVGNLATSYLGVAAAIGMAKTLVVDSVNAYMEQEKAIAQVRAGLESTGGQVGFTLDELRAKATRLQRETLFGDEVILKDATAQLLTFTNISREQFSRTQEAALDLATRLDGDLKSASIQLGKALNDPVANLSALSRSGIQFSKEQKAVINELVSTNRLADAQTLILDELNKQYGGSAKAAAEADGGFTQINNTIVDLQETLGKIIVTGIKPFTGELKEGVTALSTGFDLLIDKSTSFEDKIKLIANAIVSFLNNSILLLLRLAGEAIDSIAGTDIASALQLTKFDIAATKINALTSEYKNLSLETLRNVEFAKRAVQAYVDAGLSVDEATAKYKELVFSLSTTKNTQSQVNTEVIKSNKVTEQKIKLIKDINALQRKQIDGTQEVIESEINLTENRKENIKTEADLIFERLSMQEQLAERLKELNQEVLDDEKAKEAEKQKIINDGITNALNAASVISQGIANLKQTEIDNELREFDRTSKEQLAMFKGTTEQRAELEAKLQEERLNIERKGFEQSKKAARAQALISYAQELAGIYQNSALNPANAVTFGVAGVIQAATLAAIATTNLGLTLANINKAKFAEGTVIGDKYVGYDSYSNDTVPALLSQGEAVIPASSVNKNRGVVNALIANRGVKLAKGGVLGYQPTFTTPLNTPSIDYNVLSETIAASLNPQLVKHVTITQSEVAGATQANIIKKSKQTIG